LEFDWKIAPAFLENSNLDALNLEYQAKWRFLMNKRMVTFVSIVITVFILGTAAVIIRDVSANKGETDPQVIQDQLLEREQVYNQVITEANQRIEQLNAELNGGQADQTNPNNITPENAALIALATTNYEEPLLKLPELVDFEGKVVYEVQVKSGVIYLDAQSGEIVFNGVPQKIDAEQAAVLAGEYLGGLDPKYGVVKQSVEVKFIR
jgi:uncharacterized membrane protein YkoI